jgi:hypothetical protein
MGWWVKRKGGRAGVKLVGHEKRNRRRSNII